ncbi:MAG: histidine kinase [Clostridiaceae bacterium]|nr:histidine kinase [Clostridiaceae bacterium]
MRSWLKTVKAYTVALMLCFALAVSTLVISFSYYLVYQYQLRISVQSIGFNQQLISRNIERDLTDAFTLANWCSIGANPPARYLVARYDPVLAVRTYERLQEEWANKRTYEYMDRVVVISNDDSSRLLQTGRTTGGSLPFLSKNTESLMAKYELKNGAYIYDISADPFSQRSSEVVNILAPVYIPGGRDVIGTVYIALNTRVITDNLKGYKLEDGAVLYLTINDKSYKITEDGFVLTDRIGDIQVSKKYNYVEEGQIIGTIDDPDGRNLDAVSCRIRDGLTLTQLSDHGSALPPAGSWLPLVIGVCCLILLLSLLAILTLNRAISQPVARISRKLKKIAEGDFSHDPNIESDSEIGAVGHGINQLSHDVVELMETRLASEQNKKELEYRMLQSQINPHFLYNSLGAIKWMATLQKADGIAEMTTALSRLLKTVSKDQRKVVPLRDEIALLDDYFMTLKYRYGGTVSFDKYIEDDKLLDCCLPRFVLQPLMENAIFHGIEPKGRGKIELHISEDNGKASISIWDDGIGIDPEALSNMDWDTSETPDSKQLSVGLRSVHQRVSNVFGSEYGLNIESEPDKFTKMTIRVPLFDSSVNRKGCGENILDHTKNKQEGGNV